MGSEVATSLNGVFIPYPAFMHSVLKCHGASQSRASFHTVEGCHRE